VQVCGYGVSRWWRQLAYVNCGTLDCCSLTAPTYLLGWTLRKRFALCSNYRLCFTKALCFLVARG